MYCKRIWWCISNYGLGTIIVSNCNFRDNIAGSYGGAIYNNGNLTVSGNVMSSNVASLGQMI
ncbi:hypothetical protein ALNOE001_03870 [Candidatus Methanobinarius endosymbioticus]|uniref:Right handed beta helix domain-containing protein n=1 Tax=Candidatus Methanobinarius endosymbioticus TaxID=2006182 RepID=A0A366MFN0_9EURY|nr:hypothetical protein ALNOE001_03870 [Candidatus Methanobinarius endosymbioticus]